MSTILGEAPDAAGSDGMKIMNILTSDLLTAAETKVLEACTDLGLLPTASR